MATQDNINNFCSTCTAADLLELSAQTKSETTNRIIKVATVNDLPNLSNGTIDPGTIIFVESIQVPVMAHVGCWAGLDNRELRNDCTVNLALGWGSGTCGKLGDNLAITKPLPGSVLGNFTDWCQVSAGPNHSLGVRTNGTAWAWGLNTCGRLGDCTTTNRSSPVSVVGGFTDWCQVSAGTEHSAGVRTNGTLWTWGNNTCGQLGDCTTTNRSSPVSVVGGFTDWCQVSVGLCHTLAVRTNGTAWGFGFNTAGQLGDGNTTGTSSPVSVVGGFTDWCQVSTSCSHSLGVRTNGTVWGWGSDNNGRLGDNSSTSKSSPVSVVGGFTDWCRVSTGSCHSLGLRTNGSLWAWGFNNDGQLGDNCTTDRSSPVSVVGGFTDWCYMSAGLAHTLGIRTNGTAWAWGANTCSVLGDGTSVAKSSPVSNATGNTDWYQVSAGCNHSLGIRKI